MAAPRLHRAPRSFTPSGPSLRALVAILAAIATVLTVGGVAFAYLTATGTGTGTATTGTLNPPTSVAGSQVTHTSTVAVSWTAPVGGVAPTGYYVLRTPSPSGTTVAACGTSAASPTVNTSCNDASVPNGSYTYAVVAVHFSWTATSAPSAVITVVETNQSITFTSSPSSPTVGGTYLVSATGGGSGNPVTFSSATPGTCTVAGSTVTLAHAGTCTINANQAGNAQYNPAPQVQQSFTIAKAPQTISYTTTAPVGAVVGGPGYTPAATGGASGNPVVISIDATTSANCSISGGGLVTYQHVGTCTVNADQAGNADYFAASTNQQSYGIGQGSQAITFTSTAPANAKVGGATYNVTATGGGSLNAVTFTSATPAVCTLSGPTVSFVGAGTCTINANQAGNADYLAATQVQQSFNVTKQDQTITFTSTAPSNAKNQGATYNVTATASSGLTVALTVDAVASSVCALSGSTVSFIGAGTCVINANQVGNGTYNAAPQVQQTFTVAKGDQTISFTSTAPVAATNQGATYNVTATASSGLTVALTIDASAASVCALSGSTVSFIGAGTCVINANQVGNLNFNAAPQVQQSFAVAKANQTISFTSTQPSGANAEVGDTYTPTATATSGLTVTFGVAGGCTISAGVVTFTAVGTCTITASQVGNANWNAATPVTQTPTVIKGNQTISFTSTQPSGANAEVGDTYTPTATATSGLTVTFGVAGGCTIASGVVTFTAAGTCTITASQAGNANWNAATPVAQNVTVIAAFAITSRTSVNPQNTTTVSGTGTPGATVTVYICNGNQVSCSAAGPSLVSNPNFTNPQTTTVAGVGTWSVTFSKLLNGAGTFTVQAYQTTPAANARLVFSVT